MPPSSPISHVSDTARWVATYRAMESARPDAIFRDPYAARLAGLEGEAIVATMAQGKQLAWPMIVRTAVMDEIIQREVAAGTDGVLNLAVGLDARAYRLPLPAALRWYDVDLPGIMEYRTTHLAGEHPACALESVTLDLTDRASRRQLFQRVAAACRRVLVVSEGLLVYLTSEQVAELSQDLSANPTFTGWLTDLASPRLLRMLKRTWGQQLSKAPMLFGPAEGTAFFAPFGWDEAEFRSTFEEAIRLKRTMRFAKVWQFLGRLNSKKKRKELQRMSGIVLMKRKSGMA